MRALHGANATAVIAHDQPRSSGAGPPTTGRWCPAGVRRAGPTTCGGSPTSGPCGSHPNKPKRWIVGRYFGKFNKFRNDRWVFGDRDTGAYLPKFAWTQIVRHTLVTGRASPDDPALADYWAERRQKVKRPAGLLHRAPADQAGRAVPAMRGPPADPRPAAPVPRAVGTLVAAGHQEGDQADYLVHHDGPAPHENRTHLVHATCHRGTRPGGEEPEHAQPEPPSGLAWAACRENVARAVLRGPRCSNAPGLPGSYCMTSGADARDRSMTRIWCRARAWCR